MSAPVPTADIGCDFVKISASGPMPTSRYCDHSPSASRTSLTRAASARPRPHVAQVVADDAGDLAPHTLGLRRIAARLLLDDALEHARNERHAGGLDRLQVAGRHEPRLGWVLRLRRRVRQRRRQRCNARQLPCLNFLHDAEPIEELAQRRRNGRQIEQIVAGDENQRGSVDGRHPQAANEKRAVGVGGEAGRRRKPLQVSGIRHQGSEIRHQVSCRARTGMEANREMRSYGRCACPSANAAAL